MSSLPFAAKAFPIPVVSGLVGPGTQTEDDALDYVQMPSGMSTYRAPVLPEPEELAGHTGAVQALNAVLDAVRGWRAGEDVSPVLLAGLPAADLDLIHQVLGEGEVSAQVIGEDGSALVQIQESVFAGVWRVLERRADGRVRDTLQVGAIPQVLIEAAREDGGSPAVPVLPVPPTVVNAPALLSELADHRHDWRPGETARVVNLTLLPMSNDDIAYMDHHLGTGRVVILSRGYGNCRITDCRVPNTWRVVYYNSQDTVILNSVEVTELPEVACAAPEDLADSEERLVEVLQWVEQTDQ